MPGLIADTSTIGPVPYDLQWWRDDEEWTGQVLENLDDDRAARVFSCARAIMANNVAREDKLWRNLRVYNGTTRDAYAGGDTSENPNALLYRGQGNITHKVNRNVVASVTDTLVSTMTSTPIKTTVLSDGGDYSRNRKRSKTAEKFANGVKYRNKFEAIAQTTFLSALVMDLGFTAVHEDPDNPGEVKIEFVFTPEMIIDEIDGMHGSPRQAMRRHIKSREVVKGMLLKAGYTKEEAHDRLQNIQSVSPGYTQQSLSDKIDILEAWHLPSSLDADDGMHIVCIEGTVITKEPWTLHRFPFARLSPSLDMIGYYGFGVCSDLIPVQYEINDLSQSQQRALKLGSNFVVLCPKGSNINKNHILNGMGLILEYSGEQAPTWAAPNPVSPAIPPEIANLVQWAYQRWGVSPMASQGEKPPDVESGEGMRVLARIESVRHSTLGKKYQAYHLDVDELIFLTARMIDQRYEEEHQAALKKGKKGHKRKKLIAKVPDKHSVQRISWEDADPGDGFVTKLYPTNLLADSPSDRLDQVMDMVDRGQLSPDVMFDMLPFPDLEKFYEMRNAPRDNILAQLDRIIEDGDYRSPEPFQDLSMYVQLFQTALLTEEDKGLSDDRLQMLQRGIAEASSMLAAAKASQMPPAPTPTPGPTPPPSGPPAPPSGPPPGAP